MMHVEEQVMEDCKRAIREAIAHVSCMDRNDYYFINLMQQLLDALAEAKKYGTV